mmetsp:Transcript_33688/g.70814  ORF Transcript_33688/g.70814 Transcript_33688/m.70814 type:complete len:251 (-) Transcript_33688:248-1000(-)
MQNPLLRLSHPLLLPRRLPVPLPILPRILVRHAHSASLLVQQRPLHARQSLRSLDGPVERQHQVVLLRLGGIRIVNDDPPRESHLGGTLADQYGVFARLGVELQYRPRSPSQHLVQRGEESHESSFGNLIFGIGVAQPLEGRDGYAAVERGGTEGEAGAHVVMEQIPGRWFCVFSGGVLHGFVFVVVFATVTVVGLGCLPFFIYPFVGHVEHVSTDITSYPYVAVLFQHLTTQTATASHIQNKTGPLRTR